MANSSSNDQSVADAERKTALALFGLDTMADEWAERTNLRAMARSVVADDAQADKLVALMKQSWVEGAYEGRMSQFTDPPRLPTFVPGQKLWWSVKGTAYGYKRRVPCELIEMSRSGKRGYVHIRFRGYSGQMTSTRSYVPAEKLEPRDER